MDDIEKAIGMVRDAWRWFNHASPLTQFWFGLCGMAGGLMGLGAYVLSFLRSPEAQRQFELIHEDVKETKALVVTTARDVNELKVTVGRMDERQIGFERELRAHDSRGVATAQSVRELRDDVREAIGRPLL